jgi:hypothetical protein
MRTRCFVFGVAAALAAGVCSTARAQGIDHGHSALEAQFERGMSPSPRDVAALSGFALFGVAYSNSVLVALLSDRASDRKLYIPVVGPWLDLGERDCAAQPCSLPWLSGTLLVVDGVVQGAGVALLAASLFLPDRPPDVGVGAARVEVWPVRLASGAYGLEATGKF